MQRKFRDSTNEQYASNAALSFLSRNESMRDYQRKRIAQSFEPQSATKRVRSHIPSANNRSWDTGAIVKEVQEWPEGTHMNWSEVARRHGVPGGNAGQIVKEIAIENGIDVSQFSTIPTHKRQRACKHKLPGKEISIPANPTPAAIRADIKSMLASGTLSLGEPCAPFSLSHMKVVDGQVVKTTTVVHGRRMPLASIRQKLLGYITRWRWFSENTHQGQSLRCVFSLNCRHRADVTDLYRGMCEDQLGEAAIRAVALHWLLWCVHRLANSVREDLPRTRAGAG